MIGTLKQMLSEPNIYALTVRSSHGQILHLGVHFSLDEAYTAARRRIEGLIPHRPGGAVDIDMWDFIPAREAISRFADPQKVERLASAPQTASPITVIHASALAPFPVHMLPPELQAILKMPDSEHPIVLTPNETADKKEEENTEQQKSPTVNDYVQNVKESKNVLMQKLIDDGDVTQVEKVKYVLGVQAKKYILDAIAKKKEQSLPE